MKNLRLFFGAELASAANRKLVRIKSVLLIGGICLAAAAAGCDNGKSGAASQLEMLKREKVQLEGQIQHSKAENEQLKKRVRVLTGLKAEIGDEVLSELKKVRIGRYTNFYDKDKDGKKEKLIVYIQPIDQEGDAVKAPGSVEIQLWDLNRKDGHALLNQWHVGPKELRKLWFATVVTANYRLTFDVGETIDDFSEPLTVKMTFTDYLSGKVFTEQKVIKP